MLHTNKFGFGFFWSQVESGGKGKNSLVGEEGDDLIISSRRRISLDFFAQPQEFGMTLLSYEHTLCRSNAPTTGETVIQCDACFCEFLNLSILEICIQ